MPRKTPVYREMRKRYPGRVFNSPEEAENYKTMAAEKGLTYETKEYNGQFYVDEPKKAHPYWGRIGG